METSIVASWWALGDSDLVKNYTGQWPRGNAIICWGGGGGVASRDVNGCIYNGQEDIRNFVNMRYCVKCGNREQT